MADDEIDVEDMVLKLQSLRATDRRAFNAVRNLIDMLTGHLVEVAPAVLYPRLLAPHGPPRPRRGVGHPELRWAEQMRLQCGIEILTGHAGKDVSSLTCYASCPSVAGGASWNSQNENSGVRTVKLLSRWLPA